LSIKTIQKLSRFGGWWLLAAIPLLFVTSCRSKHKNTIVIRVWDFPRPAPQGVTKWEDHWEYKIFKEFEREHPGVKIEYTRLSWRNGGEKLDIAVLSGNPPDLAGSAFKNAYVERGVLEPIDPFLTSEDSADIYPQALQPFTYNGHIYAWPWYMTVYTLILNKRIFAERGVPLPKNGIWTWDEFVDALQKLTFDRDGDGKIDVYGIAFTLEPDHTEAWAFIHSEGAKVLVPLKSGAQSGVSAELDGFRNVPYIDELVRHSQQAGRKIIPISNDFNNFAQIPDPGYHFGKITIPGYENGNIIIIEKGMGQHLHRNQYIHPFLNKFPPTNVLERNKFEFYTLAIKRAGKLEFPESFVLEHPDFRFIADNSFNICREYPVEIVSADKIPSAPQSFAQLYDVYSVNDGFNRVYQVSPINKYHHPFHFEHPLKENSPRFIDHRGALINAPSYLWIIRLGGSVVETNYRKLDMRSQGQFLSASLLFAINSLQARPISEDTFSLPYQFGFNTPEGIRGVKKLYDLIWKYHVAPPQTGGLSQNETWNMFTEGRVAVTPQGTWAISSLVRTNRERRKRNAEYISQGKVELVRDTFEFAVANFPIGSTGKVVTASPGVGNWVVFKQKDTVKLRLVMELARKLTSAENQRYLRYLGTFPTRKSAGNIYADDPELGPYMSVVMSALENVVMRPFHPRWQQISDAVSRELQLAILGEKTVKQAMSDADRKVSEILKQFELSKSQMCRSSRRALVATLIILAVLIALIVWGLRKTNLRKHSFAYLALVPVFVVFTTFVIVPIILSIVIAFEEYEPLLGIFRSPFVGIQNFVKVVEDESFRVALKNTFLYTVIKVPWNVFVALILASLLYPLSRRAQSFYRAAYYLPGVASAVVISMIWRWIFDPTFGLANMVLTKLGLPPQPWLTSPRTAFPSIILSDVLMAPGAGVILYLATMGRIPKSVIESAKIDGASGIKLWWHVIVPLLTPTTLFMLVVNTIGSFQVFTKIYILTKGGPGYATNTLVFSIYKRAFEDLLFGMASAEAFILFAIVGVFSFFQFRMFSKELEY